MLYIKPNEYPDWLRNFKKLPSRLYYNGNIELINSTCIAIVGSRHCSKEKADIGFKMAYDLARAGLTIVSGLAIRY